MIRFYNGLLLSMKDGTAITHDEVWVENDKIKYVGSARADAPKFERSIDLQGNLLMPGFKNAHAHVAMSAFRSLADDMPLQQWLTEKIFPMEGKLTPERSCLFTKLGILEMLAGGITAAFDMYYHRAAVIEAANACNFRLTVCGGSAVYSVISGDCKLCKSSGPLIDYIPGLHAEYTSSPEEFEAAAQLCRELKAPCFSHNAETALEVEQCRERRNGMTPTEYMESLGLFEYGGGGFHCVHLTPQDEEIFLRRKLWAVTCPASNAKLASGIAPVERFRKKGIRLAIGTDGASSNNAVDMFREMYLVTVLQKLREQDAAAFDATEALKMACVNSAEAMGLYNCNCIEAGKQADLIVLDLQRPNMRPCHNIVKNIVYSGNISNVKLTMIAGKILYENGEFPCFGDVGKLYEDCARETAAMLAAL